MFALLKKSRNLSLPMDIMLKLFNVLVKPVVLYGAEVWGSEKCDILERLQLRFFKYVLSVNKFTSSMMVYGELGAIPLVLEHFGQDYVLVKNTRSLIRSTLYYIH